jgi:5-methylcytosine-specific restriction endonuclease McrA
VSNQPRLYKTKAWKGLRNRTLIRDRWICQWPGCGVSLKPGRKHPRSAVVDHRKPHRGDARLFHDPDNLWSLCKAHHDSAKQSEERRGYSDQIGEDGFPVDPRHPFNA